MRTTKQVFQDHMNALLNGDFSKIMADYSDDAFLVTVDGIFAGKAAIQDFFLNLFSNLPNAKFSAGKWIVENDTVLIEWSAESDAARIPQAVDTFIF
jgi:ketosteroid isomerase-like protein